MTLEEINTLIKTITRELIDIEKYPFVIESDNVRGIVLREGSDSRVDAEDFEQTIGSLSKHNQSKKIIAVETFERIYKSTGDRIWLNSTFNNKWIDFEQFLKSSEMIEFYVFDEKLNWCAWFGDDIILVAMVKELAPQVQSDYSFEWWVPKLLNAHNDFVQFIKNTYKV